MAGNGPNVAKMLATFEPEDAPWLGRMPGPKEFGTQSFMDPSSMPSDFRHGSQQNGLRFFT